MLGPWVLLPAPSLATPVVGKLNITGGVVLSATAIDFLPVGGGNGTFVVESPATGDFAGLVGTSGFSLDLTSAGSPVGVPVSHPNFLLFAASPTLFFTLTSVDSGVFASAACFAPPAAGQTCTAVVPATFIPAFNLANTTSTSSVLSFNVRGTAFSGSSATGTSDFQGILTTQFASSSYQGALATLAAGGSVAAAYSAEFAVGLDLPSTDLQITKTDGKTEVAPGTSNTYTIVVSNPGPAPVVGATVADVFPASFTAVTYTSFAEGGATGNSAGSGDINDTVNLPVGSTITYTATGTISPSAEGGLSNIATVTPPAEFADPNLANNSATDNTLFPVSVVEIPTLGLWGLMALVLGVAWGGLRAVRPR